MFISCPNKLGGVMVMKWDNNSVRNALVNVLGTYNRTCITESIEVVDLEKMSSQNVICFKGLD